jgi:hypothetical protein
MTIIDKTNNNKCLQECGKKRKSYVLLVGMQISVVTVEISLEAPQKTKNKITI